MMKRPLRVLQIIHAFGMGGAETWLMELLRLWSRTGDVQLDFLLTSGEQGVFDDEARQLGAGLHYHRFGRDRAGTFLAEYRRLLATGRFDAIHDHSDFSSGWRYLMGMGSLPAVRVTHVHNPTYQISNNHGVTLSRRLVSQTGRHLVANFATYIAGTSRQMLEEYGFTDALFRNVAKGAVYCGFDPDRFSGDQEPDRAAVRGEFGWPTGARVVLFAGRIDQSAEFGAPQNHKNSGFAVDAVIAAAHQDPNLCAVFAGAPSPASQILAQRISEAGLSQRIRLVGVRTDIERLMRGSDVLLFPSRAEGLGMVAVEAQAAGMQVLASDGVPTECVVASDLVTFKPVSDGVASWASSVIDLSTRRKAPAHGNQAVSQSPFAIGNSARTLELIYAGRVPS